MKLIAFIAVFFILFLASGQNRYILKIFHDSVANKNTEYFFPDSLQRSKFLSEVLKQWETQSYFEYEVLNSDQDSIQWLIRGDQYKFKIGRLLLEGEEIQIPPGYRRMFGKGEWGRACKEIVLSYCNEGFPFTKLEYNVISENAKCLTVDFMIFRDRKIVWDSLVIKGNAGVPAELLEVWLKTEKGKPFSAKSFNNLEKNLKNNKLFKSTSPPVLRFLDSTACLTLFLKQSKNDLFSGVAGFSSDPVSGKLRLNGEIALVLNNSFRHADLMDFRWRSLKGGQSMFDLKVSVPFVFRQPFAINGSIKMLKYDTNYINTNFRGGVMFLKNGTENGYELFVSRQSSAVLSPSIYNAGMGHNRFLDFNQLNYGVRIREKNVDREVNPRRGVGIELAMFAGNKKIIKNNRAPEFYYDSVKMNQLSAAAELSAFTFIPFTSKLILNLRTQSAYRYGSYVPANEFYQIGGLDDLRGFEENSIRAENFLVLNSELKYAFEEQSNIFVFADLAKAQIYSGSSLSWSGFFSAGIGTQMYTRQGLLNIVYALGKNKYESLLFKNSRIHIGYTLTF